MSTLEDLNPAYIAVRYPDTEDLDMEDVGSRLKDVEEMLAWIRRQ